MREIRRYDLILNRTLSTRVEAPATPAASRAGETFEAFLGSELAAGDAPAWRADAEERADGLDLEYVAAEMACRRVLSDEPSAGAAEPYPVQTAYFLRNQRRPESSPMRRLRLGGMLKAASLQIRNGSAASGLR